MAEGYLESIERKIRELESRFELVYGLIGSLAVGRKVWVMEYQCDTYGTGYHSGYAVVLKTTGDAVTVKLDNQTEDVVLTDWSNIGLVPEEGVCGE